MASASFLSTTPGKRNEVEFYNGISAQWSEMRKSGQLCDCVVAIGSLNFPAHKAVLTERIPFFADVFLGKKPREDLMHALKNIKPRYIADYALWDCSILEALLLFAYERNITITDENVDDLAVASRTLGMEEVKMACIRHICQRLNKDTVMRAMDFARENQFPELLDACRLFFCGSFESLLDTEAFRRLTAEDMLRILNSDRLNVSDESVVFRGLLAWINSDTGEARKDWFPRLFPLVRLPLLSRDFLEHTVAKCELCRDDETCMRLIYSVRGGARFEGSALPKREFWRDNSRALFVVGTPVKKQYTKEKKAERVIEVYNRRVNQWEGFGRFHSDADVFVVINENIYCLGSRWDRGESATVNVFNTLERRYDTVAPMHKARKSMAAVVVKQRIFVCGGLNTSCEIYDPPTNTWTLGPCMTSEVRDHCLVDINDRHIVTLGGYSNRCSQKWAEVMTLNTAQAAEPADWFPARASVDCWQWMPPMLMSRSNHSACFFRGRIIVVGGGGDATCAEMFVSEAESEEDWVPRGQWTLLPLLTATSLTVYAERLFSIDKNGVKCCLFSESKMTGKEEDGLELPAHENFPRLTSLALANKSIDWEVLPPFVNTYTVIKGGTAFLPDYFFDFLGFCDAFSSSLPS
ncbi:Kelch-like protein 10 [Sparganum proliferum]